MAKKVKMKTVSGAKKRFRRKGKGYKVRRANRNHILTKNSSKSKRQRRGSGMVAKSDVEVIDYMLGKK